MEQPCDVRTGLSGWAKCREGLQVAAALHRFEHGDFIRVLEIRADGYAHGDARDADAERFDQFREVDGSGFAFGGRIRRNNNLLDCAALEALDEAFDLELIRTNALQRREGAAQNVVQAAKLARSFHRLDIRGFFDHADQRAIARRARAEKAWIGVRDVVADRAFADFFLCFANGVGKRERLPAIDAQQIERKALRGFLPDAGQAFEFVDQSRDGRREIRHSSSPCQDYCKVFRGSLGVKRKARSSRLRSQRFVA
jgi:hypothetical protein